MSFHGLVGHVRDCFNIKMSFIWFFKPYVFNGIQRTISVSDIQSYILQKLFLKKFIFL